MVRSAVLVVLAALSLAACTKRTLPPGDLGICYSAQTGKDGALKYFKLSQQKDLEHCAAALEAMRVRFISMGGNQFEIMGAYQGSFIFVQREGILTAPSLEAHRYVALVRSGDGRLVVPGAVAQ